MFVCQLQSDSPERIVTPNLEFTKLSTVLTNFIHNSPQQTKYVSSLLRFFFPQKIEQSSVLEPWFSNFNTPSERDLFNMPSWFWLGSSEGGAEILHFYKFPGDFGAVGLRNTFLAAIFKRLSEVFEIASKYCISESFVDHDGYSISSEGFLPAVVDKMVIWVKFTHSSPFQFADS